MNQPRTTYQSDYTPFDWFQNNVISDMNDEFCSSENVDECLKHVSQEFSALGYPSIYSNSSTDCPSAVNCDIVKFLNVTYELLRSHNEHRQTREDLENRNLRLSSDLNVLNKKNSQLKVSLEQNERKLASVLERERQLKEKNEQMSQILKAEKDETKRLTAQLCQQKIAYQHNIKRYESNMTHIKSKISQLLSDKNINKKIASFTTSQNLPRNSGQRGKWKTGSTAISAIEDMYNSVIATSESRCKDLYKELCSFRQFMQSVLLEILEIVSTLQAKMDGEMYSAIFDEFVQSEIKKESSNIHCFEDKFKYLFSILKEAVSKKADDVDKSLKDQVSDLKTKLSEYEKVFGDYKDLQQVNETQCTNSPNELLNKDTTAKSKILECVQRERMKVETERIALEKENAELSAQKIAFLRLAIQQKIPQSSWHGALNISPSLSVITSQTGSTRISSANQVKVSLSTPEKIGEFSKSYSPQWICDEQVQNVAVQNAQSDNILLKGGESQSTINSPLTADIKFSNSDLPSWATNETEVQSIVIDESQNSILQTSQNVPTDEGELPSESSSEEVNLLRLKAAIEDIEKKRTNIS